jgi:phage tail-like protein
LAVTRDHYLVVGNVTQPGLFLFDLHAGGEPLLLLFPEGAAFEPFDLAAAPDGGVWVLDRVNRRYWGLDRSFRLRNEPGPPQALDARGDFAFPSCDGEPAFERPHPLSLRGFPLPGLQDPVSIEALPDGSVLILDHAGPGPSALYHHRRGNREAGPLPLEDDNIEVEVLDDARTSRGLSLCAYDMAYNPQTSTLYVVECDGKQAFAVRLDLAAGSLTMQTDYLPLHSFGGRALMAACCCGGETGVFYDVTGRDPANDGAVRWVGLHALDRPRYETPASLYTPPLDGKDRDCVWHRLFLDACLPPGTAVAVWTRAHNDRRLLPDVPFTAEPPLYLRGAGAEVPFYDPFPDRDPRPPEMGTWELLFQQAHGRYLQVRLDLSGPGRATPALRALRAYYPRFSYPRRYLPAAYLDDAESADFLERLLANPEGFFSEIEGKMALARALFDARSAPPDVLDWLAGWVGLVLDPLWARLQEVRQTAAAPAGAPPADRRRLFIRFARKLYERRGTVEGIQFAMHLLLDPCLETTLGVLAAAALRPNEKLRRTLADLGLPYPTPTTGAAGLEDLLYDYVLSPKRPSKVRLVEAFQTRGGRAAAAGDPTGGTAADAAHRFAVLVPENLSDAEAAMVDRVVGLEKPAHTAYDVRRYWDYYRVGEARLGTDTVLGEEARFVALTVGRDALAQGYLSAASPRNVRGRVISDRDRLGALPPL